MQLADMGFSREHAMEALFHTTSLEGATDWILTHEPPMRPSAMMDLDLTEEDQLMRAIAMSLGESPQDAQNVNFSDIHPLYNLK